MGLLLEMGAGLRAASVGRNVVDWRVPGKFAASTVQCGQGAHMRMASISAGPKSRRSRSAPTNHSGAPPHADADWRLCRYARCGRRPGQHDRGATRAPRQRRRRSTRRNLSKTGLIKNSNGTVLIGKRLDQDLAAKLQRPVRLANDANCFALSKPRMGRASALASCSGSSSAPGRWRVRGRTQDPGRAQWYRRRMGT